MKTPKYLKTALISAFLTTFLVCSTSAQAPLVGDLNEDHTVDSLDLRIFASQWLAEGCMTPGCLSDLNGADSVNIIDLALMAKNWRKVVPHINISEFMASNSSSPPLEDGELLDGNGEASDWIEIYNPTDTTISLDGWYLTDSNSNLTMWQFPNGLELDPGEFLIVFASDPCAPAPYRDPAGYYHTNFELDKDGDFLALVTPDGNTIAHKYSPEFPPQLPNISYGMAQNATTLLPTGATVKYYVPDSSDSSVGTEWTELDYDDSEWETGETGLGFGRAIEETGVDIGSPSLPGTYYYDDGLYTIYGNGMDIWDSSDSFYYVYRKLKGDGEITARILYMSYTDYWAKAGVMIREELTGSSQHAMMIVSPSRIRSFQWRGTTNNNSVSSGAYAFSMPYWLRIRRTGDILTGYFAPDEGGNPGGWSQMYSTYIDMVEDVHIGMCVTSHNSGMLCTTQFDNVTFSGGISNDLEDAMLGVNSSLWTRIEFDSEDPFLSDMLMLRVKYEDGFAAYLNGEPLVSRNAPTSLKWDSAALSNRLIENALVFEEINLMTYLDLLQNGRNVLAIHALNDNKNDDEFLISPELFVARNRVVPEYFTRPTPGTFNIPGAIDRVSEVWFSTERTFYNGPPDWHIEVYLSTATEDAEIRYTVDGSLPTITHGRTYNPVTGAPLIIDKTTTLRAVAVKPGWLDSKVETNTYIFLDDVIRQSPERQPPDSNWPSSTINEQVFEYGMDPCIVESPEFSGQIINSLKTIPTISLVTELHNLFDKSTGIYVNAYQHGRDWECPVSVELIHADGSEGFQIDAGLRIRGGYSRGGWNPKHAFRLFFRAEYGETKLRYPLFGDEGADEYDHVDLRCSQNYCWAHGSSSGINNTMIREVFSRDLQGQMGHTYTRSRYYHLYINGVYWGLFQTQERSEGSFAASYMGGNEEDYDVIKTDWELDRQMSATDGDMNAYYRLYQAAISGFYNNTDYYRVQGLNIDGTPNPAYERLLDVDNLIDYMIIEYYTGDRDGPGSRYGDIPNNTWSIYNRVNPDGWKFMQHDSEHSLGTGETNLVTYFTWAGQNWEYFNPHWLHERLAIQNAEYRLHFADHVQKHLFNGGLLSPDVAIARVDARAAQIDLDVIAESARWGDGCAGRRNEPPYDRDNWLAAVQMVRNWITNRNNTLINQFRYNVEYEGSLPWFPHIDAPTFNQNGGEVPSGFELTLHNPNGSGSIYYTLDGSDPRQPITGTAVGIHYNSNPIILTESKNVKARVLDGDTWSALNETIFAIGGIVDNLRITEIMYHPKNTGNINDPNTEFIELKNIGQETINLNLVKFTEGIDFTFPDTELEPNEFVILVKNISAFNSKYASSLPPLTKVRGPYNGSLANDGEQIKLVDAIDRAILDFEYGDGWYPVTDGGGFSLTTMGAADNAISWPEDGLVAHWKLDDEPSSTIALDSAGTNHGTLEGDPVWTTGKDGGALSFDNDGDYISLASIDPLTGDSLTAQAWIRLSEFAGTSTNPILTQQKPSFTDDGYYLDVSSSGVPKFSLVDYIDGGDSSEAVSGEAIVLEEWYHIAGTNDGSSMKLYVNGRLKASSSSAGLIGKTNNAYIGYNPASYTYYAGLIDDVRIYDRALAESEFQDIEDPMGRWNRRSFWRPSVYRNGSPGWDDSGILPNPGAIVINEVMSHSNAGPDWIELYNTTDEDIDIGGWFLSDSDVNEPNMMKYRIADGTTIFKDSYLVFYEDVNFGTPNDPGCLIPFALSENGEKVCVSSRLDPNGMLTGYRDIENFGASQTNVSFGRYYKGSTGTFNFVAMDYNTPDSNNAYPRVGPVVINEIMYNPLTGNQMEEYIELYNITASSVTLYRADKYAPWKFTDGVDYTFSTEPPITILGHGYLLVVKQDPEDFRSSFEARYGYALPHDVQVVGGYDGYLSNSGERLQIGMPGDVDGSGTRQYIRIDRVTYSDGSHPENCPGGKDYWPVQADGYGFSLSRKVPSAYGNDVSNWKASIASPGIANP